MPHRLYVITFIHSQLGKFRGVLGGEKYLYSKYLSGCLFDSVCMIISTGCKVCTNTIDEGENIDVAHAVDTAMKFLLLPENS